MKDALVADRAFHYEYREELTEWLRRRFRLLCLTLLGVAVAAALLIALSAATGAIDRTGLIIDAVAATFTFTVILTNLQANRRRRDSRHELIAAASRMVLILGMIDLTREITAFSFSPENDSYVLFYLLVWHLLTSLFLPWTPRESMRPMWPMLTVWAVWVLLARPDVPLGERVLTVAFLGPLVVAPGLLLCGWRIARHSKRFRNAMMTKQFASMRRDYGRARMIHETMFPQRFENEEVRFRYVYEPMLELGGDYVHFHRSEDGIAHVVLLDVTGHGLPAALTVNRLYGEIERIRGETPDASPRTVLRSLNRYVDLTLRRHNIFVTGFAASLDPQAGILRWSNAGHPPAFLRHEDGAVTELTAGGVLMGAVEGSAFDPGDQSMAVEPGDVVIAFTDGVFEVRDRRGDQFGLAALRDLVRQPVAPDHWPKSIEAAARRHRAGAADDDVLIMSLAYVGAPAAAGTDDRDHGHAAVAAG